MLAIRRVAALIGLLIAVLALTGSASAATFSTFTTTTPTIEGGKTISVSVRLASGASSGGQLVSFSSSNSYAVAPASATILAGRTSVTAKFTTRAVSRNTSVTLTAETGGTSKDIVVTLTPPKLSSLSTPTKLVVGAQGSATVRLSLAPIVDTVVSLESSDPSIGTAPETVTILAGKTSVAFKVTAGVSTGNVTFTASFNGVSKTDVTAVALTELSSVSSPSSLVAGKVTNGSVRITGAAYGEIVVSLSSSNPSIAAVPATVTILHGKTSAYFPVSAIGATSGNVTITATLRTVSKSDVTLVKPASLYSIGIVSSMDANDSTTAKVRLNGFAPAGGLTVTLSASPSGILTFPATVTVPQGADFVNVPVTSGLRHSGQR